MTPGRSLKLLLVEDNLDDVLIFSRAIPQKTEMQAVPDAITAISYLAGDGPYRNRQIHPVPDCILLSWSIGPVSGEQFLNWLKSQSAYRHIPTIVCSASLDRSIVDNAYTLGANSFVRKPIGLEELRALLEGIVNYWSHVTLPPRVFVRETPAAFPTSDGVLSPWNSQGPEISV